MVVTEINNEEDNANATDDEKGGGASSSYDKSRRNNTNTSNHYDNTKSSTLSLSTNFKNVGDIPIVELSLENVSYKPITTAVTISQSKKKSEPTPEANNNNNRTTVLSNITTKISPYELTAWMGPSGSGKTSLTSVVANLINDEHALEGTIKVNGEEGKLPKRCVGLVWQDDLLLSNLTVEETIYFAARLKTSSNVNDLEVQTIVENVMKELNLLHIRHNKIGSTIANIPGISGGERKRTSVAAELVVRPSLLLLDEPTSGKFQY